MLLSFQRMLNSLLGFVKLASCFFNFLRNEGSRLVKSTAMTLLLLSNALNIDNTRNRVPSSIYSSVVSRSSSELIRLFESIETIVSVGGSVRYAATQSKAFDEGFHTLRKSFLLVRSPIVQFWKAPRELYAVSGEFWMRDRGHYSSMAPTANVACKLVLFRS